MKQFIEHLTGRVVLMKNEHDQNRDFPHTHSIRLPAQESHKQGNQIFAVTQRKELACNCSTRTVPCCCARWLQLPAAHSRPNLGSSRGPRSAPPPAAGGAAGHADQQHLGRLGAAPPTLGLLLMLEPDASLRQESRAKKPAPYCLRVAQRLADLRPAPNK